MATSLSIYHFQTHFGGVYHVQKKDWVILCGHLSEKPWSLGNNLDPQVAVKMGKQARPGTQFRPTSLLGL